MLYQSNDFTKLIYTGEDFPKENITLVKSSNDLVKQIGYITNGNSGRKEKKGLE